jgi:hypothetical protein
MNFNSQNVRSMMFEAPNSDIALGVRREKRSGVPNASVLTKLELLSCTSAGTPAVLRGQNQSPGALTNVGCFSRKPCLILRTYTTTSRVPTLHFLAADELAASYANVVDVLENE